MNVNRADVVILNAPFIIRPGSKLRPMLVIQNDNNNARMANTILAMITTNTSRSHDRQSAQYHYEASRRSVEGIPEPSVGARRIEILSGTRIVVRENPARKYL